MHRLADRGLLALMQRTRVQCLQEKVIACTKLARSAWMVISHSAHKRMMLFARTPCVRPAKVVHMLHRRVLLVRLLFVVHALLAEAISFKFLNAQLHPIASASIAVVALPVSTRFDLAS